MIKRLMAACVLSTATLVSGAAMADDYGYGGPGYAPAPVYGYYGGSHYGYPRGYDRPPAVYAYRPFAPHNGGRDAADPAYASPDSQTLFNPSNGGKTGTYADDGVSGE